MYIELFVLDNLLMNLLILRLAAALLSVRPPLYRQLIIVMFGTIYAALAAYLLPALGSIWLKPILLAVISLSIPTKSFRGFGTAALATLFSTFVIGGLACCIALITGGWIQNGAIFGGIELRVAIISGALASFLPRVAAKLLRRRLHGNSLAVLTVEHKGLCRSFTAIIDTGNRLYEPVTGLPVALVHCFALAKYGELPIKAVTAAGEITLKGFIPDRAAVDGTHVSVIIAIAEHIRAEAIIPPEIALCSESGLTAPIQQ